LNESTFAWRMTADLPAAIASICIQGPEACDLVRRHVRSSQGQLLRLDLGRIRYGDWELADIALGHPATGQSAVTEQVVVCRTQSDIVEIHCHGGAAVCRAILNDLQRSGCQLGPPNSWPSGLTCGLARAAQQDLLKTTTDRMAAILLDQMQGALRRALEKLLKALSDGETTLAERQIQELIDYSNLGLHLTKPWQIVLAGPPNVGKSSLMNALVGTHQAIVHHEPGTTRDWLEAAGAIDGLPVIFTDTAGIRSTSDAIEQAGVDRSKLRLQSSDLAILVVDAQLGWTAEHQQILKLLTVQPLIAWNKVDVVHPTVLPSIDSNDEELQCILTSARGAPGTTGLLAAISHRLLPQTPPAGTAVPFRTEQLDNLRLCQQMLQTQQFPRVVQFLSQWLSETA
jgi:tRNA modification GTPase